MPDAEQLLGVSAVARELRLSENFVRRLADAGELPCQRDAANKRLFSAYTVAQYRAQRQEPRR
jgi:hypothetical protein